MVKQLSALEQTLSHPSVLRLASAAYSATKAGGMDEEVKYRVGNQELQLVDFNGPISYGRILERQVSELVKRELKNAGQGGLADLVSGNVQELQLITQKIMEKRSVGDVIAEAERCGMDVSALKNYRTSENFNSTLEKLSKAKDPQSQELAKALAACDTYVSYQFKMKLDQEAYKMHTSYALKRLKAANAPEDSELGKAYKDLLALEKTQKQQNELKAKIPYLQKQFDAPTNYALAA